LNEWQDPFGEHDPAALERERRRAEREVRRQARLGERVRAETDGDGAASSAAPAAPPATSVTATAVHSQPPAEPPPPAPPPEPQPQAAAPPPPPPGGHPPAGAVHRRRLFAIFGLLVLAFVVLAVIVVANHSGGGGEPAPAPVKAQKTVNVTIPEGYRRSQIADIAKKAGLRGDYEAATKSAKGFDPGKYGADNPDSLEGFLFPATYELFRGAKVEELVTKQLDAFKQNIAGLDMGYARSKNLTTYDVLIIGSMVQAEAGNEGEMDQIAEVIYNRLSQGIPLGIDATIRYATGNYTKPLTNSELAISSPYNTRLNAGLPPGPIGNPGLAAIDAAANPAQGKLLFFVAKPGTCGHGFFETQSEFDAAVAQYNAARDAAGGKSPTSC
jgi:YceG-like family